MITYVYFAFLKLFIWPCTLLKSQINHLINSNCFLSLPQTYWSLSYGQSLVATGVLAVFLPQTEICNNINQLSFVKFRGSSPMHKRKVHLLKNFWRRFCSTKAPTAEKSLSFFILRQWFFWEGGNLMMPNVCFIWKVIQNFTSIVAGHTQIFTTKVMRTSSKIGSDTAACNKHVTKYNLMSFWAEARVFWNCLPHGWD